MLTTIRNLWRRAGALAATRGFRFNRPLVLFQSDDWGRVGVRDRDGWQAIQDSGIKLGERAYDYYTLETAEDVIALSQLLRRHRDASGRPACIGMNFLSANLDFARMAREDFRQIYLTPLSDGLPYPWHRPGLFQAYRDGVEAGVFWLALHGSTHFNVSSVTRELAQSTERSLLIRTLWKAATPYIHWRMPWIGYEYWDPGQAAHQQFLSEPEQTSAIGSAIGYFAHLFSTLPRSACAPGYRANADTHKAWAHFGIRIAQNGPGNFRMPHLDRFGILHLYRTVDFEPAVNADFSLESSLERVEESFKRGIPAVISVHSINFHSSLKNFRGRTLDLMDEFLTILKRRHSDILYVHDGDVYDLIHSGRYLSDSKSVSVGVSQRRFALG